MLSIWDFVHVKQGVLQNGKVAVRKLYRTLGFSDQQFEDELLCLIRVKHKNIVRCLGYCSDTSRQVVEYNGKHVVADVRKRFLCFEYAPNKSLQDYLIGMEVCLILFVWFPFHVLCSREHSIFFKKKSISEEDTIVIIYIVLFCSLWQPILIDMSGIYVTNSLREFARVCVIFTIDALIIWIWNQKIFCWMLKWFQR